MLCTETTQQCGVGSIRLGPSKAAILALHMPHPLCSPCTISVQYYTPTQNILDPISFMHGRPQGLGLLS